MKVLVVGAGGVGRRSPRSPSGGRPSRRSCSPTSRWSGHRAAADRLGEPDRFGVERVDASEPGQRRRADRPGEPRRGPQRDPTPASTSRSSKPPSRPRVTYLDMAMTLSHPPSASDCTSCPAGCWERCQLDQDERWRQQGLLALVGIGVEPGLSDLFRPPRGRRVVRRISARSGSATAPTCVSRATSSPPPSRSGRRSRSA